MVLVPVWPVAAAGYAMAADAVRLVDRGSCGDDVGNLREGVEASGVLGGNVLAVAGVGNDRLRIGLSGGAGVAGVVR